MTLYHLMMYSLVLCYLMLHYVNVALSMLHLLVLHCLLLRYWLFRLLMFHYVNGAPLYEALFNAKFLTSHLACSSSNLKQPNISFDKIGWLTLMSSSPKIYGRSKKSPTKLKRAFIETDLCDSFLRVVLFWRAPPKLK